ncbi:MAG: hypothetical protein AAB554_03605 [Patescibacteria group bacterium]
MDQTTFGPVKPIAGGIVILLAAVLIGGRLYVEGVRNELELKISALEAQQDAMLAETEKTKEIGKPQALARPVFDPSTVKVGDRVGAWTVIKIEGTEPGYPRSVSLSGSATVTGTYTYWPEDAAFLGGMVLFKSDHESSALLPAASTMMGTSFGFSDLTKAHAVFGPEGSMGSATVMVSDYTVNLIGGEVWDAVESFDIVTKTLKENG